MFCSRYLSSGQLPRPWTTANTLRYVMSGVLESSAGKFSPKEALLIKVNIHKLVKSCTWRMSLIREAHIFQNALTWYHCQLRNWDHLECTLFPGMTNTRAREMLDSGYRMPAPEGTPDEMYKLMLRCWQYEPEDRPHFPEIHSTIDLLYSR